MSKIYIQMDIFQETVEKKIDRIEKWMGRLQKELWFLKACLDMSNNQKKVHQIKKQIDQLDIFKSK